MIMLKMKGTEENNDYVEDERKWRKIMIMLKMKEKEGR